MTMKVMKVIFCICILFVIMSCAHNKQVADIQFCENQKCTVLAEAHSKEAIFQKLTSMIKANLNKEIPLISSTEKTGKTEKYIAVKSMKTLNRSDYTFLLLIHSLTLTDIIYIDRENREIKVMAQVDTSYPAFLTPRSGTFPAGLSKVQMLCSITVKSSKEIVVSGKTKIEVSMHDNLLFNIELDALIDQIDTDKLFLGSVFTLQSYGSGKSGWLGRKEGYLLLSFQDGRKKTSEPIAETKVLPLKPDISAPVKESVEVIATKIPHLAYKVQFQDQNNNKVLDGGEKISLHVEVENAGEGTATDVNIELSGQQEIIDVLGNRAQIGDIKPKQKKIHEFKGVLPDNIPSSIAMLRVRVHESKGHYPARGKSFQIAMKAAEMATEQTEIISDIDVDDIPPRIKGIDNRNNYAVVIGISTYRDKIIPKVKYASRDAETMAKYLERLAGIPKENILIKTDQDVAKSDLEEYFESWLPRRVTSDSLVYVYYAGHGTPDPAGQDAYIVPYEGHPDSPGKLYPLTKMYAALTKLPAKHVFVMLDSCFSGAEGRSVIREGTRPLVMSIENQALTGNKVVVIAGAKGNQMSSDYDKVKHGLFTYYLLRGIRGEADKKGSGIVSVGDLYEYVKQSVTRTASLEFNRDQTPDLLPGKAAGSVLSLPIARTK